MELFRQTTRYTGSVAALLMILHHFDKNVALSKETEFLLWQQTALLPLRSSSIYGLALVAKRHGLHPKVYETDTAIAHPSYSATYTKTDIDEARVMAKLFSKQARAEGIELIEQQITFPFVEKLLNEKKILLLRLDAGVYRKKRSVSKYFVCYKKQNSYCLIDPKVGELETTSEQLTTSLENLSSQLGKDVKLIVF
ncbi:MAG: peptidase C39 family protein [Candidatus Woesearchaeota archaeon]|nr:MAG: peptidase C39 family protein [Candidatus Woesearchaeota archaeon]